MEKNKMNDTCKDLLTKLCQLVQPIRPTKPNRVDYDSHTAFGIAMDEYEIDLAKYGELLSEFKNTRKHIENKLKDEMLDDVGLSAFPNRDKIWDKAWADGHAGGYMEVYTQLEELAELFLD